jgi:hypothetical protein
LPYLPPGLAWNSRKFWSAAVILLTLTAVFVRVRLLSMPLERDEGEFAYAGQLLLQGVPPYSLALNIKLPGTNDTYAAMMAAFGQTATGIHFGFLMVNLGTLSLLFYLARRMLPWAGVLVCCATYVLISLSPAVLGLEGHATHLVVFAALGGWCWLVRARENGRAAEVFLAGLFFGIAFLCKQPGLFFGLMGLTILVRDAILDKSAAWLLRLLKLALFSLGLILPLALTCLSVWRAGTFDRFWFWTFTFARVHGQMMPCAYSLHRLCAFFSNGAERWFFIVGSAGLVSLWMKPDLADRRFILTICYFFSWCAVATGLYFMRHYFLLLLPVTSLLLGLLVASLAELPYTVRLRRLSVVAPALFVGAIAWVTWENRAVWFEMPPDTACMSIYAGDPFVECARVAQYIREHSSPNDRIEVVGSEPEVYFYAQRRSVSGYIYMYDLVAEQPYASAMQKEFIHDVESARPEFLVLVNNGTSWTTWPNGDRTIFYWTRQYPPQFYDLAGIVAMYPSYTEYLWGKEADPANVKTSSAIYLFQRKRT